MYCNPNRAMTRVRREPSALPTFPPASIFARPLAVPMLLGDLDRMFEAVTRDLAAEPISPARLWQDDTNIYVELDLPGVPRDNIAIAFEDDVLTITALRPIRSRRAPQDTNIPGENTAHNSDPNTNQPDTSAQRLEHRVHITADINADGATARTADGVLTVTLPKVPRNSRQIRIQHN